MNKPAEKLALLLISRNFPPLLGGMERLNQKMLAELAKDYKTGLVGPQGAKAIDKAPRHIWECPSSPLGKFIVYALIKAIRASQQLKPQIILAGSGLTAPIAWLAARLFEARCIVYLHGLDIEVKHPVYQWLWVPFFRHFDQVLVNSHFTQNLALEAGIPADRIRILHPGVTLPDLSEAQQQRSAFRQHHALNNIPVMLYVGRITARKGLSVFVENILPNILQQCPTAQLLVVGDNPSLALLKQNDERQRVKKALRNNSLEDRVKFLGWIDIDNKALNAAYFAADVLIFPVQSSPHDNEGFGMVAIEAAAHGLPTVAFAAGGVPDAVANGTSGHLIPAGNNAAFAQAVIETLSNPAHYRESCRQFAESFSWTVFGSGIRKICHVVENKKQ